jgi:hypothetical protein
MCLSLFAYYQALAADGVTGQPGATVSLTSLNGARTSSCILRCTDIFLYTLSYPSSASMLLCLNELDPLSDNIYIYIYIYTSICI